MDILMARQRHLESTAESDRKRFEKVGGGERGNTAFASTCFFKSSTISSFVPQVESVVLGCIFVIFP